MLDVSPFPWCKLWQDLSGCGRAEFACWQDKVSNIISMDILTPNCYLEHTVELLRHLEPKCIHLRPVVAFSLAVSSPAGSFQLAALSLQHKLALLLRGRRMGWVLHRHVQKQGQKLSINASGHHSGWAEGNKLYFERSPEKMTQLTLLQWWGSSYWPPLNMWWVPSSPKYCHLGRKYYSQSVWASQWRYQPLFISATWMQWPVKPVV